MTMEAGHQLTPRTRRPLRDDGLEDDLSEFETEMLKLVFILHLFNIFIGILFEPYTGKNETKHKHTKR